MTIAKKNNIFNIIQTILISIGTTAAVGCFKFLWGINSYMAATTVRDNVQDDEISQFRISIGLNTKANERQDNNIVELFGLLPDKRKRITR